MPAAEHAPSNPPLFTLKQNAPDPFRRETTISYCIGRAGRVRLRLYDLLGRHVDTIVDATREPGHYTVTFDGGALASGVYLYRLEMPGGTEARTMTLAK